VIVFSSFVFAVSQSAMESKGGVTKEEVDKAVIAYMAAAKERKEVRGTFQIWLNSFPVHCIAARGRERAHCR
jgi:hypothetical protein